MNSFTFDGRLVRDPKTEVIQTGVECVEFTIANDRRSKNDKQTSFFNCKAFGNKGAFVSQYFKKGDPIIVSGELEVRTYDGRDGTKKTAVTVYVDKAWSTIGKGQHQTDVSSDQLQDVDTENLPF